MVADNTTPGATLRVIAKLPPYRSPEPEELGEILDTSAEYMPVKPLIPFLADPEKEFDCCGRPYTREYRNTPQRREAWMTLKRRYNDRTLSESQRREAANILYEHIAPIRILHLQEPIFRFHELKGKVVGYIQNCFENAIFNQGREIIDETNRAA